MRIIAGFLKGRKIVPPSNLPVRPTTDMAREGLFNILSNAFDFSTIRVLDLFSGTGLISLEFASRGCLDIVAVDIHPACCAFQKETTRRLQLDSIRAVRGDVFRFVRKSAAGFDLIFADPPFDHPRVPDLPDIIFNAGLLNPEGWYIQEHSARHAFAAHPRFYQHRKYGDVNFTILK
ncbi:MAG TPA: RsmD family RNA methyltransferase [Bacteroidales bacterium]|nr:RsmD family RNA methyltransferase [Bacteroidales bacterium]HNS46549.1 RsmD family RNA methyltransferase [Bacteroidales bacterium]